MATPLAFTLLSRLESEVNERTFSMTFAVRSYCEANIHESGIVVTCALRLGTLGTFYVRLFFT